HVFPFSLRPGTAAERLPGRVAPAVADARSRELRALGERKAAAYRAARVGGSADVVVVSGGGDRGARGGVTEGYLTGRPGDPSLSRGTRFSASLVARDEELFAEPPSSAGEADDVAI